MVVLGAKNSRMRDFFDVYALAVRESFDGDVLARSLRATFERRRTEIPATLPIALTPAFADVEGKRAQWFGFLRKTRVVAVADELGHVIEVIAGRRRSAASISLDAGRLLDSVGHRGRVATSMTRDHVEQAVRLSARANRIPVLGIPRRSGASWA